MYTELMGFVKDVGTFVWGPILMVLLLGTGIYFTVRLKLIQLREFFHGLLITMGVFEREKHAGEIKHFQALCTALSATIGTGNIAGVATKER